MQIVPRGDTSGRTGDSSGVEQLKNYLKGWKIFNYFRLVCIQG